jgi:thiol-disulfide isomerase/thioredoxin
MFSKLTQSHTRMPSLDGAIEWLNSEPLTTDGLRGHVVAVDFWTYTCINWLRTLPYIRAWAEKYKDQGLIVIGAHTPEFPFERDLENVRPMVKKLGVDYPVAVDSNYAIWDAFANRYWPALYLVDKEGGIRYEHFGEGRYEESEEAIQELLGVEDDLVSIVGTGLEAPADWDDLESPETYLGYGQGERFASPGGGAANEPRSYVVPERLRSNHWALEGEWTIQQHAAVLHEAGGKLAYRFHARDVHLVLSPAKGGAPLPFRVSIDGQAPGASHGDDIDEQGEGVLSEPRLHQLVRQSGGVEDRTFEITFLEPGAEASCFTFG